jgi:hypothetical protein
MLHILLKDTLNTYVSSLCIFGTLCTPILHMKYIALITMGISDPFLAKTLDVMALVLSLSAVDRGFNNRSPQTKDCTIVICCFCAKQTID